VRSNSATLRAVALRLIKALGEDSCVVIGAIAVAAHGYARATTDVDLIARIPLAEARNRLSVRGVKSVQRRGEAVAGDFPCIRGVLNGIEFDILPPLVPIEWEKAVDVPVGAGATLRIVDLPTLIHLKLRAGGPQDLLDVVMLLQRCPEQIQRARELATAYRVADQMESFMSNPRIRAKAPRPRRRRRL
jgi:nucleotidyltransferase AbiEii toxin of type IV toxin-antitoxin system